MQVRFRTLAAGPKGVFHAGAIYEVPEKDAAAFIDGKFAVVVGKDGKEVKSVKGPIEQAVSKGKSEKRG